MKKNCRKESLQGKPQPFRILCRHSKDFAIKNAAQTYGNEDFTITLSGEEEIMRKLQNTFAKIQFVGTMMNCTQKNKGYGLCPKRLSYKGETGEKAER